MPHRLLPALAAALAVALAAAPGALARGGDDEARASGSCTGGGRVELRLKADGVIRAELRADGVGRSARWRVVLVHERRVAARATVRSRGGDFRVRRTLPGYPGANEVTAIASGPAGARCQSRATVSG